MIETAMRELLLASPTVTSLVATRIYPDHLPQRPILPAITYQRVSRLTGLSLGGPMWPTRVRVQMDCWAESFDSVRALAAEVIGRLLGFAGHAPDGQLINQCALEVERGDTYEPDTKLWRVSMDWAVVCKEGL